MKKFYISISLLSFILLAIIGCEDFNELTAPKINFGTADFTRFVCIGNSLTMGEQSTSIFESAQQYSFGNIIAKQVGTTYAQATFSDPGTVGRLEVGSLNPFTLYTNPGQGSPTNLNYPAPYNNLGIKSAFVFDVMNARSATTCYTAQPPFNTPNPLFDVVLRGLGTQMELALAQQPTLVTLWIGNNDILAFATRGGLFPPTSASLFQNQYTQILTALSSTGAPVIIGSLPNGLLTPFFTTVGPGIGLKLQSLPVPGLVYQTTGAPGIAVATANQLLTDSVLVTLSGSSAAGLIGDQTGKYYSDNGIPVPPGVNTAFPFGLTPENPFPNGLVLDPTEIAGYKALRAGFNDIISGLAATFNYPVINWDDVFNQLASSNGLLVNGVTYSTTYIEGNFFSLDGIHPTSQGYGIIANEFIKAINEECNAQIPLVDVSTIPGSLVFEGQVNMGKYGIPIIPYGALDNVLF